MKGRTYRVRVREVHHHPTGWMAYHYDWYIDAPSEAEARRMYTEGDHREFPVMNGPYYPFKAPRPNEILGVKEVAA